MDAALRRFNELALSEQVPLLSYGGRVPGPVVDQIRRPTSEKSSLAQLSQRYATLHGAVHP